MTHLEVSKRPGRPIAPTRNPVIAALFAHIQDCGYTYGSIEERAGIAPGRLYRWKAGISNPTYVLLSAVAEAVGLKFTLGAL